MTKADSQTPPKYLTNDELRAEIVAAVGIRTDRYGSGPRRGLSKCHLLAIARELRPSDHDDDLDELTLAELYRLVCRWVGSEYQGTAGNQWGINRENLKRIHRELRTTPK